MTTDDLAGFQGTVIRIHQPDFLLGDETYDVQAAVVAEKHRLLYKGRPPVCRVIILLAYCARIYEISTADGWRWGVVSPEGKLIHAPDGSATKCLTEGVTRGLVRESCGIISLERNVEQILQRLAALEAENALLREQLESVKFQKDLGEVRAALMRDPA